MSVSIILLAHNEAQSIAEELRAVDREIVQRLPGCELLVAEDGSVDGTRERIIELAKEIPLRVVGGPERMGYRRAVAGALRAATRQWVFLCDAGLKHDPADFWRLYDAREQYDLVIGRRTNRSDQWHRRVITWGLNAFLRFYFGLPVHDADSGMRLLSSRVVAEIGEHPLIFRECSGSEMVVRALAANLRCGEVPVSYRQRVGESSGMPLRKIPKSIWKVLSDARALRRELAAGRRKTAEREFFDALYADEPVAAFNGFYDVSAGIERYRELIFARCAGARVLEYGCGTGAYAVSLAGQGARAVAAIDISPEAIEQARRRVPAELRDRVTLQVGDAEALEFADGAFDLVCGTGILHHLNLERALPEIRRVLAPGGRAIFYEPLGHNPALNLYRVFTPHAHTPDEHPLVMRDFAQMRSIFGSVSVEFYDFLSLAAIPLLRARAGRRVFEWLERVDARLFALAPPVRAWASFAVVVLNG